MLAKIEAQVGIASIAIGAFLLVVGIPYGVSSPSNVPKIVLSPLFWPQILAGVLVFAGVLLVAAAPRARAPADEATIFGIEGGVLRLALMAAGMVAYFVLIPVLGMVWSSMLAFAGTAFLVKTHHPLAAGMAAILVPLALYAFFAHVAGVAIPQGDFVRLP